MNPASPRTTEDQSTMIALSKASVQIFSIWNGGR